GRRLRALRHRVAARGDSLGPSRRRPRHAGRLPPRLRRLRGRHLPHHPPPLTAASLATAHGLACSRTGGSPRGGGAPPPRPPPRLRWPDGGGRRPAPPRGRGAPPPPRGSCLSASRLCLGAREDEPVLCHVLRPDHPRLLPEDLEHGRARVGIVARLV